MPKIDNRITDEHRSARPTPENGRSFRIGEYVQSGSEVLECSGPGVWIRKGELPE